jgi:hypothetical protein
MGSERTMLLTVFIVAVWLFGHSRRVKIRKNEFPLLRLQKIEKELAGGMHKLVYACWF